MARVELLEHTADVGLRIEAESLEELFREAGRAVLALSVDNPEAVRPDRLVRITIESEDVTSLFIDWLRELVFRISAERLLLCQFDLEIDPGGRRLEARCRGEQADWSRHQPGHELKAVTYHGLEVRRTEPGWFAQVIFDV